MKQSRSNIDSMLLGTLSANWLQNLLLVKNLIKFGEGAIQPSGATTRAEQDF